MRKEWIGGTKEAFTKIVKFARENPRSATLHSLTLVIAGLLVAGSWYNATHDYTNGGSLKTIGTIFVPALSGDLLALFTIAHFVNKAS